MKIRPMTQDDWPRVEAIYSAGIAGGNATFEREAPTWEAFDTSKIPALRLVTESDEDQVVAWAAASPVSTREVYAGVAEHSVYVAPDAAGRGVGGALLRAFVEASEAAGYWMLQSAIFPENAASLALHDRVGFRQVGRRERIALMRHGPWAGQWRDVVLIERRSDGVG